MEKDTVGFPSRESAVFSLNQGLPVRHFFAIIEETVRL